MNHKLLTEENWKFRACGGDAAILAAHLDVQEWMSTVVPGTTHGQLLESGKIPDPYYDRNELDLQWIDQLDWEFRCEFTADADDATCVRQELLFEGLDTVATVLLNGKVVGESVNMFRRVICDVRGVLVSGTNELVVRLTSPTAYSIAESRENPDHVASRIGSGDFVWETGERRETRRSWIRKVQCHFGWDWGVCLPTQGIWLPCRLECADTPRLDSLNVAQRHVGPEGDPTSVELTVDVRLSHCGEVDGSVVVSCDGEQQRVPVSIRGGAATAVAVLCIDSPKLWWPNGYGEQALYDIKAEWEDGGMPLSRRIGLRTMELRTLADESPDGKPGESMTFVVNGRAIYAKGGNWIPADQFVERCTPEVYRHLLTGMTEAHMNMVRVWGGGWYELDVFYNTCDELGLLVWQDFMMACAIFPDTESYIAQIVAEARDQVRRLQHHACIALWCGDNENLTASTHWWGSFDPEGINRTYRNMMTALRDVAQEEDPTRRFWVSSPSNGWFDEDSCESREKGDVHFWDVWHGRRPFSRYLEVKPRFCSEFGFQSFAEPRTMRAYVPEKGLNPSSWHMEHHQRSGDGNMLITNAIARELPIPDGFDAYCWESQINQANAIRTAVEHWRRAKPWCSGALYWQINDLWPVASWSSIDWLGRWKALHHSAARFFAPLLVSITYDKKADSVSVWVTSDVGRALSLKGKLIAMTFHGEVVGTVPLQVELAADASVEVATADIATLLGGKVAPRAVCLFAELAGDGEQADNYTTLVPWKYIELPRPTLTTEVVEGKNGLELQIKTDKIAAFVHAEIADSESHFAGSFGVLRPDVSYRWPLVEHSDRGQKPISVTGALEGLSIFSLYDLAWRE